MAEIKSNEKAGYDVYDYVFSLEEQLKGLQTEKQMSFARITQLQLEIERMRKEINEMKIPPLVVGTIEEVLEDGKAIVRNSNGMEFLVKAISEIEKDLEIGKRVGMNQRSLAIIKVFLENKDWRVNSMEIIEKPKITFADIGGLEDEITELDEAVILPLTDSAGIDKLGIEAPNGVLLHGPPGTGKTLLAKAVANKTNSTFISLSGSELVRKYIGEGSRLVRDVFKLAREKKPSIIFIDEIDAVASHRYDTANGDREVQRTLMQLLAEMDGFHDVKGVKIIGATNRIDMLDPALLRPGRFDRIVEIGKPDEKARKKIFEIHSKKMIVDSKVTSDLIASITPDFTGADLKSLCMEAGMLALRKKNKKIKLENFEEAIKKLRKDKKEKEITSDKMFS